MTTRRLSVADMLWHPRIFIALGLPRKACRSRWSGCFGTICSALVARSGTLRVTRSSGRAAMRARGLARRVCCARVLRRKCHEGRVSIVRGAFRLADNALGEPQIHAVLTSQDKAQHRDQDSPFSRVHPVPGRTHLGSVLGLDFASSGIMVNLL